MAHRYSEAILVRRGSSPSGVSGVSGASSRDSGAARLADDMTSEASGAPTAFAWRGVWYRVDEILATWRLRDRWWAGAAGAPAADVAEVDEMAEDARVSGPVGMPLADALPSHVSPAERPTERSTERLYFRALCRDPEGVQVFDLYYDVASGQWVLDRAHD